MNYDYADEIRDNHSLNEFLAQPKNSESISAIQYLLGEHLDQVDSRYLVFSMQINNEIQRFSLPIIEGDNDGTITEARANELANQLAVDTLYHGHKVFMRSFQHQPEGQILT